MAKLGMTEFDDKYKDRKLKEIPKDVLERAVNFLKSELSDQVKILIRQAHSLDKNWITKYHFGWGMDVRNSLRDAGFKEDQLPDKNWDDYYGQVVEIAVGLREMPKVGEKEDET